jgi:hypothetical protein
MQATMELSIFKVTPELSRQVGHAPRRIIKYPDMGQVKIAGPFTLLTWYRNLPSAETVTEREILDVIRIRLGMGGEA